VSSAGSETQARRQHLFRGRRVRIRDLVDAGLLEPAALLVYDRPQVGEKLEVTVTETGQLLLPDGREITSPSGAISNSVARAWMAGTLGAQQMATSRSTVFGCV
jgi:hypothetical protein